MPLRAGPFAFPPEPSDDALSGDSERELVARVRAGDEGAFERIFTTYFPALCGFVRGYVHTPDQAEEVVQEVFLRIWQQRAQWSPTSIRAYLFGAVRNSGINFQRHDRVVARFEGMAAREATSDMATLGRSPAQPDAEVQAGELAEALREAVRALPERRRQVVILRWEHQLSQAEIASVLGISVRTVETQFARASVFLRKRLAAFRR